MQEMIPAPQYALGKKELIAAPCALLCGMVFCNFTLFGGGLNLGFSIALVACMACAVVYLLCAGCRPSAYAWTLMALSLAIGIGFARSADAPVKVLLLALVAFGTQLSLCLAAGQNLRSTAGLGSVWDAFRGFFVFAFGGCEPTFRGLFQQIKTGGKAVKNGGAILAGLALAVPMLAVMIPLLISADAAFSGVMALLPEFEVGELITTLIFGTGCGGILLCQIVALRHQPKFSGKVTEVEFSVSALTVNTVLISLCALFAVYLVSQLAYFAGGFSGILPEEFTLAEYARRGFFEMAWICAIDLGIIAVAAAVVRRREGKMPLSTRFMCLFVALMTLFFVVSASAKMLLYIDSYGLTRLRLLTEIAMVFLGIATVTVVLWLFVPKLPYFKVLLITGMIMGALVIWTDVDTVVAGYNVTAYQQGRLERIDMKHLRSLGPGALPYIAQLTDDPDLSTANAAKDILKSRGAQIDDFREWNYANHAANELRKANRK